MRSIALFSITFAFAAAFVANAAECNNSAIKQSWNLYQRMGPSGEPALVQAIERASGCSFDISEAGVNDLKSARLPDSVIAAMIAKMNPNLPGSAAGNAIPQTQQTTSSPTGSARIIANGKQPLDLLPQEIKAENADLKGRLMGSITFRIPKMPHFVEGSASETIVEMQDFEIVVSSYVLGTPRLVKVKKIEADRRIIYELKNASSNDLDANFIGVQVKKMQDGTHIVPKEMLEPGEYAVILYPYAWTFRVASNQVSKLD